MAGFNYGIFRRKVEDSIVAQAERRTRGTESRWLSLLETAVIRMQSVGRQLMTYRTFNYAASMVGMLFYNGQLLGEETEGYEWTSKKRSSTRTRNVFWYKSVKKNPVYGFEVSGEPNKPWEYAVRKGLPMRTGNDWAKYTAEEAKKAARATKGYVIVLAVGMPYADFDRGGMRQRTLSVISTAAKTVLSGGGIIKTIPISIGSTQY